ERLRNLARKMLKGYPNVRRWEQTDDVLQNAVIRLHRALQQLTVQTPLDFFRLAALNIRRELLDMAKHYYGPHGPGAHHATWGPAPPGPAATPPGPAASRGRPPRPTPRTTQPGWRPGASSTARSGPCRTRSARSSI